MNLEYSCFIKLTVERYLKGYEHGGNMIKITAKFSRIKFLMERSLLKNGLSGVYNMLLYGLTLKLNKDKIMGDPITINLEPTGKCNLRCTMCKRTYYDEQRIQDLTFDRYLKIIGQFKYLNNIIFTGLGEGIMNKDFFRIVDHAKNIKKVDYIFVISNGTLLNREVCEKFVNSGIDKVSISFDGATKETYNSIRAGADYDKVLYNIKTLVDTKKRYGSNIIIHLGFVLMKKNAHQMKEIVNLAHKLGVSTLSMGVVNPNFTGKSEMHQALAVHVDDTAVKEAEDLAKSYGLGFEFIRDVPKGVCGYPWQGPYITADGYIATCCVNPDPRTFNFGNILETPYYELKNSQQVVSFRKDLASGGIPPNCKGCPLAGVHN